MNVAVVKTGKRGRPAYARLSGTLSSTQFRLSESPVLCLESSELDLFGSDAIYICPSSLPSRVVDDLVNVRNPHVVFVTPGKMSFVRVLDTVSCQGEIIPVYFGRVLCA